MMTGPMRVDRLARRRIAALANLLVDRWAVAEREALRPLFRLLAAEGPVSVKRLAEVTGRKGRALNDLLDVGRAGRDEHGRLVELFGVAVFRTRHRIVVDERELFACCALVSLMVPIMLGRPVRIESSDPMSGRSIRLLVDPLGIRRVEPRTAVACLVMSDRAAMVGNVRAAICDQVLYFGSARSCDRFLRADRRRFPVSLGDLHATAAALQARIWGS
jgi:hypothetical protein